MLDLLSKLDVLSDDEVDKLNKLSVKYPSPDKRDFAFYQEMAETLERGMEISGQKALVYIALDNFSQAEAADSADFLKRITKYDELKNLPVNSVFRQPEKFQIIAKDLDITDISSFDDFIKQLDELLQSTEQGQPASAESPSSQYSINVKGESIRVEPVNILTGKGGPHFWESADGRIFDSQGEELTPVNNVYSFKRGAFKPTEAFFTKKGGEFIECGRDGRGIVESISAMKTELQIPGVDSIKIAPGKAQASAEITMKIGGISSTIDAGFSDGEVVFLVHGEGWLPKNEFQTYLESATKEALRIDTIKQQLESHSSVLTSFGLGIDGGGTSVKVPVGYKIDGKSYSSTKFFNLSSPKHDVTSVEFKQVGSDELQIDVKSGSGKNWNILISQPEKLATADDAAEAHPESQEKIESNSSKIEVSEKGREWMSRNRDIFNKTNNEEDGGLIDTSTLLKTQELKERLMGRLNQALYIGEGMTAKVIQVQDGSGYQFAFEVNDHGSKETWYISESPYYNDQFPGGAGIDASLKQHGAEIVIWKKGGDKLIQNVFKASDFFKNPQILKEKIQQAGKNYASENADEARIASLDIPKNEKIGYIGLVDANPTEDTVISGLVDDIRYFPEMMNQQGYQFTAAEEGHYVEVGAEQPIDILRRQIQEFQDQDIKTIYLNLAGHGDAWGIEFNYKDGAGNVQAAVLSPDEIKSLFNQFSECKFVLSTVACHGGGYADMLKDYKDVGSEQGRVAMLLQTKSYGYNQEGRLAGTDNGKGGPETYSSYYNTFFNANLQSGMSLGQAHLAADKAAKRIIPCDAEAWISTDQGGLTTASLDAPSNYLPSSYDSSSIG